MAAHSFSSESPRRRSIPPRSPSPFRKIEQAYRYFTRLEASQERVTLGDICQATGYTPGTARIYLSKKWAWFLHEDPQHPGRYYCRGLRTCPKAHFIALHRQKWRTPAELLEASGHAEPSPWVLAVGLSAFLILAIGLRLHRRLGPRTWRVLFPLAF